MQIQFCYHADLVKNLNVKGLGMKLSDILKDSPYKLTQFSKEQIQRLDNNIVLKDNRGKQTPYVKCLVRNKDIQLTPE